LILKDRSKIKIKILNKEQLRELVRKPQIYHSVPEAETPRQVQFKMEKSLNTLETTHSHTNK